MSKNKELNAIDDVYNYLHQQNRPYSVVDIFNNLHKQHGKTAVQKALDQLVHDDKIIEKTYGKQKIYVADQRKFSNVQESELKDMDSKISQMTENLKRDQEELRNIETEYTSLMNALITSEAEKEIKRVEEENKKLEDRLKSLESNTNKIDPLEKERITKNYEKYKTEWKKRKRMASEMLNSILENYPKGKKALMEEIGIETDEEVGLSIPN